MSFRHKLGLLTLALCGTLACGSSDADDDGNGTGGTGGGQTFDPIGPVANNAAEAWPEKPDVPGTTPEQVLEACAAWARCQLASTPGADPALTVQLCVAAMEWSGERAIPLSNNGASPFGDANERMEYWVQCALSNQDACTELAACATSRDVEMTCQEDGCRATKEYSVTCNGDTATLTPADGPVVERDCSRAFAECSPESPTGCTDRLFTACPEPPPQPDVCEGEIRLGCDGQQQVSYRDCSALGGSCTDGDCLYAVGAACETPACNGDELTVCFDGGSVALSAPDLCSGA